MVACWLLARVRTGKKRTMPINWLAIEKKSFYCVQEQKNNTHLASPSL